MAGGTRLLGSSCQKPFGYLYYSQAKFPMVDGSERGHQPVPL